LSALASTIGIAVVVYASTNLDDLLLLAAFFADPRMRPGAVIAGRYLGLAALLLGSAAAALLALAIPAQWIALLGLVPLILGVRLAYRLRSDGGDEGRDDAGLSLEAKDESRAGFIAQALSVAGVTLANGGDNFAVYIPLLATAPAAIPVYIAAFAVMTAVWCALGYVVVNNPLIGTHVRRSGHRVLPLVLIALGLYILSGAVVLAR